MILVVVAMLIALMSLIGLVVMWWAYNYSSEDDPYDDYPPLPSQRPHDPNR